MMLVKSVSKITDNCQLCQWSSLLLFWCVKVACVCLSINHTLAALIAVHGAWDEWSPWSLCSSTCGRGYRSRTRTCTPPQFGGDPCEGPEKQTKFCNIAVCPGEEHSNNPTIKLISCSNKSTLGRWERREVYLSLTQNLTSSVLIFFRPKVYLQRLCGHQGVHHVNFITNPPLHVQKWSTLSFLGQPKIYHYGGWTWRTIHAHKSHLFHLECFWEDSLHLVDI